MKAIQFVMSCVYSMNVSYMESFILINYIIHVGSNKTVAIKHVV